MSLSGIQDRKGKTVNGIKLTIKGTKLIININRLLCILMNACVVKLWLQYYNSIGFVCQKRFLYCLITQIYTDKFNWESYTLRQSWQKKKSLTIINQFHVFWGITPEMKRWIFQPCIWSTRVHLCPYKHLYIVGSVKCITKRLSTI